MEYVNSYLDKIALLLKGEIDDRSARELVDESLIEKGFIRDVGNIVSRYENGELSDSDARKNLELLKLYVITQLNEHRKKAIEILNLDAEMELDGIMIKRIVEFIEDALEGV